MERRHFADCIALLGEWARTHSSTGDSAIDTISERVAITRAFDSFETLQLDGGVLYVNGKLIAFTIDEHIGQNGFDVHFEKADSEINGAYAIINREFARHLSQLYPELKYLNREEDLGIENLRKAKRSYYPAFQVIKYTACPISDCKPILS